MSYTRALREVIAAHSSSPTQRPAELTAAMLRPPAAYSPTTAAVRRVQPLPFGLTPEGDVLALALSAGDDESSTHALMIGMTGSGKSSLLLTLTLGLCAQHSPDLVQIVHAHSHAGSSVAALAASPHVVAFCGPDSSAATLRGLVNADRSAPHTAVVIDDYDGLVSRQPEVVDVIGALSEAGQGIHLLLACQQYDPRYYPPAVNAGQRMVLRTATEQFSRDALGMAEAAHLPPRPGLGLYSPRQGATPLRPFQALETPPALVRSIGERLRS